MYYNELYDSRWKHILQCYKNQEKLHQSRLWKDKNSTNSLCLENSDFLLDCDRVTSFPNVKDSEILRNLIFLSFQSPIYALLDEQIHSIPETIEHRTLRSRKLFPELLEEVSWNCKNMATHSFKILDEILHFSIIFHCFFLFQEQEQTLLPAFEHTPREPTVRHLVPTPVPAFIYQLCPKASSGGRQVHFYDQSANYWLKSHHLCSSPEGLSCILHGTPKKSEPSYFSFDELGGIEAIQPTHGWSRLVIPGESLSRTS